MPFAGGLTLFSACVVHRSEFRAHKEAKPEFLRQFFAEWEQYADTLATQAPGDFKPWREVAMEDLSEEQQLQLLKLRAEAATSVARSRDGGGDGGDKPL